jgi:hypothetical protein
MTKEDFKKSIVTGELQLTKLEWRKHFEPVGFMCIFPLMFTAFFVKDYIDGKTKLFPFDMFLFISIPTIMAIGIYFLQKHRLKFKTVTTSLNHKRITQIIEKVATDLEWDIYHQQNDVILADTNPDFLSGSYGEQITILLDGNKVYINSICDLRKRIAVISMGRNRQNINTLIYEIQKANS